MAKELGGSKQTKGALSAQCRTSAGMFSTKKKRGSQ